MTRGELIRRLAERIGSIELGHPVRVGIDGVDAAGKTMLADELAPALRATEREVVRATLDDFHRPRYVRHRRGPLSPEGMYLDSFDYDAVRSLLLEPLGPRGDGRCCTAVFDYRADRPVAQAWRQVKPDAILLSDGLFLHRPELAGLWDLTFLLAVEEDVAIARAVDRDAAAMGSREEALDRYRLRYGPAQRLYLDAVDPATRADVVIDNTRPEAPAFLSDAP